MKYWICQVLLNLTAVPATTLPGSPKIVAPNVVVNVPGSGLWTAAVAVLGTLLGVIIAGFVANRNTRAAERRKTVRADWLARRRVRVLLRSELAAFGPYAGGINLTQFDLLDDANRRLRDRWNDDQLLSAFSEDEYELIDGIVNQAERTIAKIKIAVDTAYSALKDSRKPSPAEFDELLAGFTLTYTTDVEAVFRMMQRAFLNFRDDHLASQAAFILDQTVSRRIKLEADSDAERQGHAVGAVDAEKM